MDELFDAVNYGVIIRWPSIRPQYEKVGGEHLVMYMFKDSHQFDFVINFISKRSLHVVCWKTKGRSAHSKEFKFICRNNVTYHVKADGSFCLHDYDLAGQVKYIVDEMARFYNHVEERA